ncbi:hypothetical protein TBR22_A43220 [Luteitalea sp. TBR-22]|uniref:PAS domain S-box protein n=1 Tax=Luteitalea sp. TBR-22 TaxID=2802971 RepID=UPI001EF4BCA7|nr:PAS domain S-box protein [Luteitalea sp. TBR-22]BCS35096.2 hypothetical protein TBR22_A43220 [Luteitalea sp. TBR-22]
MNADGGDAHVEGSARTPGEPAGPPDVLGFFEALRLVMEQRDCECQAFARDARYRGLIDGSSIGVLIHVDGVIRLANQAVADLAGYGDPEQLRGIDAWGLVAPDDRAATLAHLRDPHLVGPLRQYECRGVRRDGRQLWIGCVSTAVEWDGEPARLVTVVDVTRQRAAREARRVAEERARQVEAIGKLAGGIAHEFNNRLQAIIGHAELVLITCGDDERVAGPLRAITRTAQESAGLTQRLLAFGRRQLLRPSSTDLNELVGRLLPKLHGLLGPRVGVTLTLAPGLARVSIDVAQFERAFVALATRARAHMPDGGALHLETSMTDVDADLASRHEGGATGRQVCVRMVDTGQVPDDTRLRLFEPFPLVVPSEDAQLDMAGVLGLVHQSGGWIAVEPAAGQGVSIAIYLPAELPPASIEEGWNDSSSCVDKAAGTPRTRAAARTDGRADEPMPVRRGWRWPALGAAAASGLVACVRAATP